MERIGDVNLDESPDDELPPELLRAVRRLSETLKKLDLQALASTVAGLPHRILVIRPEADEGEPLALLDPVIESVGISCRPSATATAYAVLRFTSLTTFRPSTAEAATTPPYRAPTIPWATASCPVMYRPRTGVRGASHFSRKRSGVKLTP